MKYFSLSEALVAAPISFLLGVALALLNTVLLSVLYGVNELIALVIKNAKRRKYNAAEAQNIRALNGLHFVISEALNCIFAIASGILFTVFLYIVSDGIIRLYILVLMLLGFYILSHYCRRPLDKVCYFISLCTYKLLFILVKVFFFFPHLIFKRIKGKKTWLKNTK